MMNPNILNKNPRAGQTAIFPFFAFSYTLKFIAQKGGKRKGEMKKTNRSKGNEFWQGRNCILPEKLIQ